MKNKKKREGTGGKPWSAYSVKMRKWVKDQGMALDGTIAVRHIFPRAYCVAKPAPLCAVFATPWMDAEELVKMEKYSASVIVNEGVKDVKVGDWCAIAYVVRSGLQRHVAFKLPNATRQGSARSDDNVDVIVHKEDA